MSKIPGTFDCFRIFATVEDDAHSVGSDMKVIEVTRDELLRFQKLLAAIKPY